MKKVYVSGFIVLSFVFVSDAKAVVNSLNGQTGVTQTFANDTNLRITSAGNVHTLGWSGLLQPSRGGTGAGTFTLNGVILGNTTGALKVTTAGTNGQLFLGVTSGAPAFATLSGDATITNAGILTIAANAVALGTDTTGNYVASITNGSGISGSSAAEGGTPTLALGNLTADWLQSGAFNLVLNNSASNLKILENGATPSFYGVFDVADLSSTDKTYTFPNATGMVITTGNITDISGLNDAQVSDTLTASIFIGSGSLTNNIDLGTSEVAGTLADSNISDTLTINNNSSIDWTGLTNYPASAACPSGSAVTQIADTITCSNNFTASNFVGSGSITNAVDLVSSEVNGVLPTSNGGTGQSTLDDLISLGVGTTGNYIANVTGSNQISVTGAGSESANIILGLNDNSITSLKFDLIDNNNPTNGDCLTYQSPGLNGDLAWQSCGGISIGQVVGGGSPNSILFINGSGELAQNASNFSWDNSISALKLGGSIVFKAGSQGIISVADSTVSNQEGGAIELHAGKGNGAANSGDVNISGGSSNSPTGAGGSLQLMGGLNNGGGPAGGVQIIGGDTSNGSGHSGGLSFQGGNNYGSGSAGNISLASGYSINGTGIDGVINLVVGGGKGVFSFDNRSVVLSGQVSGSDPYKILVSGRTGNQSANLDGLDLQLFGGNSGSTSGKGGNVAIHAGSTAQGDGGNVGLFAADGIGNNGNGGNLTFLAGSATSIANGGAIQFTTGNGHDSGNGGDFTIQLGSGGPGGNSGSLIINGPISSSNSFTNPVNNFISNSNSTIYVGNGTIPGCIANGDDDGGGITYITTHRGILTASVTKPSNCQ